MKTTKSKDRLRVEFMVKTCAKAAISDDGKRVIFGRKVEIGKWNVAPNWFMPIGSCPIAFMEKHHPEFLAKVMAEQLESCLYANG